MGQALDLADREAIQPQSTITRPADEAFTLPLVLDSEASGFPNIYTKAKRGRVRPMVQEQVHDTDGGDELRANHIRQLPMSLVSNLPSLS